MNTYDNIIEEFIIQKRQEMNCIEKMSENHLRVVKSHINMLLKSSGYKNFKDITSEDVVKRLRMIKSKGTQLSAKSIYKFYFGFNIPIHKSMIDKDGNRIDPNRFIKNWLNMELAIQLIRNIIECVSLETMPVLLACCIQLGTALRISDVQKLSKDNITLLLKGESILISIGKVTRLRRKRCIKSFLSENHNESMMCIPIGVEKVPIIFIARKALEKINNNSHSDLNFPCKKLALSFLKRMLPIQNEHFGIKDGKPVYDYGSGFHELRRFVLSYIDTKLVGHPEREKIVAEFADHAKPGKTTSLYIQNIVYPANV